MCNLKFLPRPLSQHHLIDPTHIPQQKGPKIQHRPTPSYHDPYARPPPKPPDISDPLDSRKDLLDNGSDRKVEIEENSPFQEGIILDIYERPDNSYVQEPQELNRSDRHYQVNPKVLAKADGHRQDSRHYKKKSFERNTFAPYY